MDGIETVGNKVPSPVMMFVYLIAFIIVLSAVLDLMNVGVTEEVLVPVDHPSEVVGHGGAIRIRHRLTSRPGSTGSQ